MGAMGHKTFRDILRDEAPQIARELELKARTASRLAKIQPANAAALYSIKNRAVSQLFRISGQMPSIRDAWFTRRGLLLSIRLSRTGSFLHFPFEHLNAVAQRFYGLWVATRARGNWWRPTQTVLGNRNRPLARPIALERAMIRQHAPRGFQFSCPPDNFWHLYEFGRPDNLNQRFDQVDIEAISVLALLEETFLTSNYMKGPLAYVGGKSKIANRIIEIFPEHRTFVEVFAGGAQVLFHKRPSVVEVLNDLDGDVTTFFRVCQLHHDELVRYLKFVVVSREWFELLQEQDPKLLTDVQRAARFFYLQKNAYAGLVRNRKLGYSVTEPSRFNPENTPELIEKAHKRLARVQIERGSYQEVLRRYDRPTTLFYLDPPYFGRKLYNFNFSEADFIELAKRLGTMSGKFVLSLNDVPEVRQIFGKFHFREIELAYTAQQTAGKRFRELLIANYRIPKFQPEVKP
jgi:DNA adenine methylase